MSGRAAKYVVNDANGLAGHDNFGFDSDLTGQDNYGYDPGYSSERSPEEEEGPPLYYHKASSSSNSSSQRESREGSSDVESRMTHKTDQSSLGLAPGQLLATHELMKLLPFISEGEQC